MCRCAERRVALRDVVSSLRQGDLVQARAASQFVVTSTLGDARALAAQSAHRLSAAHARLGRR